MSASQPSQSFSPRASSMETMGIVAHPFRVEVHHGVAAEPRAARLPEDVGPFLVELAGGHVEPQHHLAAYLVSRLGHGLQQQLDGLLVALEPRREPPFVAHAGAVALLCQHALERRVRYLRAGAQGLGKGAQAPGDQHELLHVDVVVGVGAAVDHVEHGHGQGARLLSAEVAVQRHLVGAGLGVGGGQGHPQDGVGAQAALVRGAVEVDHALVELALGAGVHAHHPPRQVAANVTHGPLHALAPGSARRRRATPPPRARRWRPRRARWPARWLRWSAPPPPRRWDSPASPALPAPQRP